MREGVLRVSFTLFRCIYPLIDKTLFDESFKDLNRPLAGVPHPPASPREGDITVTTFPPDTSGPRFGFYRGSYPLLVEGVGEVCLVSAVFDTVISVMTVTE